MSGKIVTSVLLLLLLIGNTSANVAIAQEPTRGTTLVCAGSGGDGWTLEEWNSDQLAEYETRVGRPVALAHPVTGTCHDPAGLAVEIGWVPGTRWLCTRGADQTWVPAWTWEIYQTGRDVQPDPDTGRCPQQLPYPHLSGDTRNAAATAVHLTELEADGDYDHLYAWMHPNSQAVVPEAAMEGWYRDVFAQQPPLWMTVDDVRLVEWTWDVTGTVYPSAAEVTYRQRFADGQEIEEITHLVRDNGVWRWFFGRDRAFVDEQIDRSSSDQPDGSQGSTPPLATVPVAGTSETATYTILDLGTGEGNRSSANHINARGQVLWSWGTTEDPMSDCVATHSLLWRDSTIRDLATLGIDYGIAINDTGTVLAGVSGAESRQDVLYQTDSGTLTPVDAFNGGSAVDLDDAGDLLGWMDGTAVIAANGTVETIPIPQGFTLLESVAINQSAHLTGGRICLPAESSRCLIRRWVQS